MKLAAAAFACAALIVVPTAMPSDSAPPVVSLTSPADGTVVSGRIKLDVSATDDVGVERVDYYVDGAFVAFDANPPNWSRRWNTKRVADGPHTVVAEATDAAGNVGSSGAVGITVDNVADSSSPPPPPPPPPP